MNKYFSQQEVLSGSLKVLNRCSDNIKTNITFKTNSAYDPDIKNYTINNLKNNISFWNNYWTPENDVLILHGDENDYEWMLSELDKLNMSDGLKNRNVDNYSNGGGGGIAKNNTPLFWQIIGSSNTIKDLSSVGLAKLSGHLYAHIAQPGFLNQSSNEYIKYTDMPCWFIEGQSDYYAIALLKDNFIDNRNLFIKNAYVPDGYRYKIKSLNVEGWHDILSNDGNFEGPPVTYEYWAGFLIYEFLILQFGIDKVMELMLDFVVTKNFRVSLKNIINIDYDQFYYNMAEMLVYYSEFVGI